MNTIPRPVPMQLAKRALLSLDRDARELICHEGSLWITQDRDPRDIILAPGEHFVPIAGRHTIVYALDRSSLTLLTTAPRPVAARARFRSPAARGLVLE